MDLTIRRFNRYVKSLREMTLFLSLAIESLTIIIRNRCNTTHITSHLQIRINNQLNNSIINQTTKS